MKHRRTDLPRVPKRDTEFAADVTPDLSDGLRSLAHPARMLAARMDHIPGTQPEGKKKEPRKGRKGREK